jgi:hypothetical protein
VANSYLIKCSGIMCLCPNPREPWRHRFDEFKRECEQRQIEPVWDRDEWFANAKDQNTKPPLRCSVCSVVVTSVSINNLYNHLEWGSCECRPLIPMAERFGECKASRFFRLRDTALPNCGYRLHAFVPTVSSHASQHTTH